MTITGEKATMAFGWRVYGLGVMALGMVCLALGDFDPGQPVPKDFPIRTALAYAVAAFMLVAGAAVEWRRTAAWGAAALTAYYALIVVILMNGRVVLARYAEFGTYSGVAEQLAIAAGALIIYAGSAKIDAALTARLTRLGQLAFGVCALLFGGAHFFYVNLTAPLVPKWLPPTQEARADALGRSLQPYELVRERLESRPDRRRLGRGGFACAAEGRSTKGLRWNNLRSASSVPLNPSCRRTNWPMCARITIR
ncbi:MAG: hypothetical protein E6H49_13205 [Betaproteobacteria bacterium]|nr:MAG: hypothetical protein E6H49_13205 [Betaproteobacteria bacterium]